MIKYRIEWYNPTSKVKTQVKIHEFNDEQHFNNFYKKCIQNESRSKIVNFERHYEEKREFSANDMKIAFDHIPNLAKGETFESWIKQNYKKSLL